MGTTTVPWSITVFRFALWPVILSQMTSVAVTSENAPCVIDYDIAMQSPESIAFDTVFFRTEYTAWPMAIANVTALSVVTG